VSIWPWSSIYKPVLSLRWGAMVDHVQLQETSGWVSHLKSSVRHATNAATNSKIEKQDEGILFKLIDDVIKNVLATKGKGHWKNGSKVQKMFGISGTMKFRTKSIIWTSPSNITKEVKIAVSQGGNRNGKRMFTVVIDGYSESQHITNRTESALVLDDPDDFHNRVGTILMDVMLKTDTGSWKDRQNSFTRREPERLPIPMEYPPSPSAPSERPFTERERQLTTKVVHQWSDYRQPTPQADGSTSFTGGHTNFHEMSPNMQQQQSEMASRLPVDYRAPIGQKTQYTHRLPISNP
jgi:hypothetical protein